MNETWHYLLTDKELTELIERTSYCRQQHNHSEQPNCGKLWARRLDNSFMQIENRCPNCDHHTILKSEETDHTPGYCHVTNCRCVIAHDKYASGRLEGEPVATQ